jgi:hypothetical protein
VSGSLKKKDLGESLRSEKAAKTHAILQQNERTSKEQAEGRRGIAVIADIARDRKTKISPLINTDDTDQNRPKLKESTRRGRRCHGSSRD